MQRWNNAIHRSRPAEAAAGRSSVSTTAASTVDPYILDFGTSVNVNEDLRRSIREEIQELDDSIVVSKTSKKHEEMVKSQLNQDLAHSHAEMRDLSRSTSDQLENAGVHSSFLSGLKKTLRKDLVETTGLRTTGVNNKNVMEDAEVENNVPPSGNDNKSLAVGTNKHRTNKDIIKEKAETLKKLTASIKQHGEDIDSLFLQKKTHVEAINACKKAIESEALEATAEEKRQEAELKAVDVQNKAQRKRSIKSEIQNIRTRTGAHAQGVADKTKELNKMRREMAAKEAELSKQVSAAKESWNQGEKRKAEIKAQLSPIDSKLNQYTQWLEAYETNLSALTEAKAARKKKDQEEQELLLQKEELVLQLQQAKEVLKSCELELEGSQRLGAEADQLEEANNDIERSIVVPGRLEMVRLAENKENLAMKIGEQHKDSVAAEAREKEELDLKVEEKKKVSEELLELKEKLEGEKSKNQHYLRVEKEFRENWDREISQYNTLEEKLRNAFEAGKAPIHEAEIARQAERDARIEEAGAQSQDMRDRSDRYVQILLYGAETIKNGEERLYVLNDDPMIDL